MLQIRYFRISRGRESVVTCKRDDAGHETFTERNIGEDDPGRPFMPNGEEREIANQCLEAAMDAATHPYRITYEGSDDLAIDWIR